MSRDGTGVSAEFASLNAARRARDRLARAGFARNSIDIERHGDGYAVHLSTREENRARAARLLDSEPVTEVLRRGGGAAADAVASHRGISLFLAVLAGFALFGLTNRR